MAAYDTPLNGKQRDATEAAVDGCVIACPDRPVATPEEVQQFRNGSTLTLGQVESAPSRLTVGTCGEKPMRGWVIGPPLMLAQATNTEIAITGYDYSPDPDTVPPEKPEPTCPPWKFGAQRDKRHSHRRTNRKGNRN